MDFAGVEAEFGLLKARFESGSLTEAEFKARLEELMIEDEQGRWWMIGYETGRWYVHDGEKWAPQEPPTAAPSAAGLPGSQQPNETKAVPIKMLGVPKVMPSAKRKDASRLASALVDIVRQAIRKAATNPIWFAVVGLFICGVILEPIAIVQARKAKKALEPGEPGHGKAVAAEIIAWIGLVAWILYLVFLVLNEWA